MRSERGGVLLNKGHFKQQLTIIAINIIKQLQAGYSWTLLQKKINFNPLVQKKVTKFFKQKKTNIDFCAHKLTCNQILCGKFDRRKIVEFDGR